MNPLKTVAIFFSILIILCSATIANAKFNSWNTYKREEITKNYLDMLEDETGNLGSVGRMGIYRKAVEKATNK